MLDKLRPYQIEAIDAIWSEFTVKNKKTALCVASTGSGKGHIIAGLCFKAIEAKPDIKILILFNKIELLSDLAERFRSLLGDSKVGIYCASYGQKDLSKTVTVASIQSLPRDAELFNLTIVDETHAVDYEKGRYIDLIEHQLSMGEKHRLVGFTATPYRKNGYIYGKDRLFEYPCFDKGLLFFIANGNLVPPIAQQPLHETRFDLTSLKSVAGEYSVESIEAQAFDRDLSPKQVADALIRMEGRKKVVWFCSTIKHAEKIKELLTNMGETAVCIHSNLNWDDRKAYLSDFRQDRVRHLTFVTIFSEGFDEPKVDCVVLLRPTKSPVMMVQTCGRALRPSEGKENALLLDYADVFATLGPLTNPIINKKSKKGEAPEKVCPSCQTYLPLGIRTCHYCGYQYPEPKPRDVVKNVVPDTNADILGLKPMEKLISKVTVSKHISANGNRCIKVTYWPLNILDQQISEFFIFDREFGYKNFQVRATELGITLVPDYETQCLQKPMREVEKIEFKMDGKYYKVKRVVIKKKE